MSNNPAYTDSMNRLIDEFARLPGIGRRTAERLAFHVLKAAPDDARQLARAIDDVKSNVKHCSRCYNLTEADPCAICAAGDTHQRDGRKVLVVEQPKDVITLEQAHGYDGVYHVLLGHIAPLDGVGPGDLTIGPLVERCTRLAQRGAVEVILGTNPNVEGDGTALHVAERLKAVAGVTVTRLARGLPTGTQLEYANKAVLADAIVSRQSMK